MDKETLLKMSVEERLKTLYTMDPRDIQRLVYDEKEGKWINDDLLAQVSKEIKENLEFVDKLRSNNG